MGVSGENGSFSQRASPRAHANSELGFKKLMRKKGSVDQGAASNEDLLDANSSSFFSHKKA